MNRKLNLLITTIVISLSACTQFVFAAEEAAELSESDATSLLGVLIGIVVVATTAWSVRKRNKDKYK